MININQFSKFILFTTLMFILLNKQQAQVVINGQGIININGGITSKPNYFILNNPPATPIKTIGTTGGIMMESEYNITKYNLGILTTSITIPYFSSALEQFPLTVSGISGAGGPGNLQFSSKKASTRSSGWDNATYVPSDVIANPNTMSGYNPGFVTDNSMNVIDRFWIIDAVGYTTSPAVTYNFSYINAEGATNGGNTITLANLQAMAYDRGATTWGNYGPTGLNTTGAAIGTVSGTSVSAGLIGNVFRTWTLVDYIRVLPIELLNISANCLNNGITIDWSTASESNSDYFSLEKSYDGQNFSWLANKNTSQNSTGIKNYSYFDYNENSSTIYYRLSETDINGQNHVFKIITTSGCDNDEQDRISLFSSNGNINIIVNSKSNQFIHATIYDITGRLIYRDDLIGVQGNNNYTINPTLIAGVYLINIETNTKLLSKRILIIN